MKRTCDSIQAEEAIVLQNSSRFAKNKNMAQRGRTRSYARTGVAPSVLVNARRIESRAGAYVF